jgi:hypothetical protein
VFDTFWALGSHERQWDFIRKNTTVKSTESKEQSKRKVFRKYSFTINGRKISVCKFMFMSTLAIWDCWIDSAHNHINQEKGGTATPEKRGRHAHHFKTHTPEKIASVIDHVNSFVWVPSHYCRKRSAREYLETSLTLQKMSRLYVKWAADKELPSYRPSI